MYAKSLLILSFICGLGEARIAIQARPRIQPSMVKTSNESELKTKLQTLQNRFLNKTVDLKEVEQYADSIRRNYTQELKKSVKLFQKVFVPHIQRRNETSKNCTVRLEERKMSRGVVPRRIWIGVCGSSRCSSSDVTCSCQASKIAFKRVMVKVCQRKRRFKRPWGKRNKPRKMPKQGRRCTWRTDVMLSAVACECKCQNE